MRAVSPKYKIFSPRRLIICAFSVTVWLYNERKRDLLADLPHGEERRGGGSGGGGGGGGTNVAQSFGHAPLAKIDEATLEQRVHLICDGNKFGQEWAQLCRGGFVKNANSVLSPRHPLGQNIGNHRDVDVAVEQATPQVLHLVQIGAHVGFEPNDPFGRGMSTLLGLLTPGEKARFHWTFVEPSPANFKRLQANIVERQDMCTMKTINAAVVSDTQEDSAIDGMSFFSISESIDPETGYDKKSGKKFPRWITQVSSLTMQPIESNRDVWTRLGLQMEDYVVEQKVAMKRYSDLMGEIIHGNNAKAPFFVLIDTEGFDCDIILGISWNSPYLPKYMIFEDSSCGIEKKALAYEYLKLLGYEVTKVFHQNTVAFLTENED